MDPYILIVPLTCSRNCQPSQCIFYIIVFFCPNFSLKICWKSCKGLSIWSGLVREKKDALFSVGRQFLLPERERERGRRMGSWCEELNYAR